MQRRALVLETDPAVRGQLGELLPSAGFEPIFCGSLSELGANVAHASGEVAIVDGRAVDGLLVEEHRHDLTMLSHVVPLVLVVDPGLGRQFTAEDLGVGAVLATPFGRRKLLAALHQAASDT